MIPDKVSFTGLDLDPREIHEPRKLFDMPYPVDWVRHQFTLVHPDYGFTRKLDRWLEKNIDGRWGSYVSSSGQICVIYFEKLNDAILFRLKDGENAWKEEGSQEY